MNKQPVYYMQTDPRWKDVDYSAPGEKTTIGRAGCGPTCAAMLIETITGKTFTPVDAAKWSLKHGGKAVNQGTYYSYFTKQFKEHGIACERLNTSTVYGKPNDPVHGKAFRLLQDGYYLIACMGPGTWTRGGHFVVVWWKDGKVRINDPNSKKTDRTNGDYNTFKKEVKYYWSVDAGDDNMIYYEKLNDVPEAYKTSVQKAINKGVLKGFGKDVLNVSEDLCRMLTILERLKLL